MEKFLKSELKKWCVCLISVVIQNTLYSAYQNKGNPYSKAHCSKVNRFENLHVAYK